MGGHGAPPPRAGVPANVQSFGHMLSGGASGVIVNTLIYPFYTLQHRQSVLGKTHPEATWGHLTKNPSVAFAALGISNIETFTFHGIFFYVMSFLKTRYLRANPQLKMVPVAANLSIGMLAGLIVQALTTPLKVLFMRVNVGTAKSVKDAYDQVLAEKGWTGFWSGLRAGTILVINPAGNYYLVDVLTQLMKRMEKSGPAWTFLVGMIAKQIVAVLTFPLNKAKNTIQGHGTKEGEAPPTIVSVIGNTIRKKGILALFDGVIPKLIHQGLHQGVQLMVKEQIDEAAMTLAISVLVRKPIGQ